MASSHVDRKYLALSGGVGGAKLCLGLAQILTPSELAFVVNTGDDFEHLGLHVAPDLDTLMYTLSGLSNPETGWGRTGESWNFMAALKELGGEDWFRLGDRDLAVHVRRTQALCAGCRLTDITRELCQRAGIAHTVLPMSDDRVPTVVRTPNGPLAFQHYFVRDRCEPQVTGFEFAGSDKARLSAELLHWLHDPALAGVIICPSNPFVSIDPVLALPGLRDLLLARRVPIVAISPIVAGSAIKGPTAKMMKELAIPSTATAVAAHYRGLIDGFIVDERDANLVAEIAALEIATIAAPTVMVTLADRIQLARITHDFIQDLRR